MPKKPCVYLLRHGEIELPGQKRFVGQRDLPLSAKGKAQALWWQKQWASTPFARVYCSDLKRSQHTAELVVGDQQDLVEIVPELREIGLGKWEGLTVEEIQRHFPGEWEKRGSNIDGYRPPRGESFSDLRGRVLPLFEQIIAQPDTPVLIVGHAGVNRVIMCHLLGMPLRNLFRLSQDYGALNIVEPMGDDMRLRMMNMCPNLQ